MRSTIEHGPVGAVPCPFERAASAALASGVIFDVPNVLYDATQWPRWLWRLVNQIGIAIDFHRFEGTWQRDFAPDVACGRREYHEAFQSFLLACGLSWAQVDEVEAASRIQRHVLDAHARPLAGVARGLAAVSSLRVPLAAWADLSETAIALTARLARLGLAGYFQCVLTSFDLQCALPAPDAYAAALDSLTIAADRAIFVGHDRVRLAGARAAGLRTVAFNYQAAAQAECYLTRFEDLFALVKDWPADSTGEGPASSAAPRPLQGDPR
jgi:FMN phosphatase YigB (HAD superfamily)